MKKGHQLKIKEFIDLGWFENGEWIVNERLTSAPCDWISFSYKKRDIPAIGFKIHISSSRYVASDILEKTIPILHNKQAHFKVVSNDSGLKNLLNGKAGLTQIGKFITVYPYDNNHFIELANTLNEATQGFVCPEIPNEKRVSDKSIIYYRYGGFINMKMQLNTGEIVPVIKLPTGEYIQDKRGANLEELFGIVSPLEYQQYPKKEKEIGAQTKLSLKRPLHTPFAG